MNITTSPSRPSFPAPRKSIPAKGHTRNPGGCRSRRPSHSGRGSGSTPRRSARPLAARPPGRRHAPVGLYPHRHTRGLVLARRRRRHPLCGHHGRRLQGHRAGERRKDLGLRPRRRRGPPRRLWPAGRYGRKDILRRLRRHHVRPHPGRRRAVGQGGWRPVAARRRPGRCGRHGDDRILRRQLLRVRRGERQAPVELPDGQQGLVHTRRGERCRLLRLPRPQRLRPQYRRRVGEMGLRC